MCCRDVDPSSCRWARNDSCATHPPTRAGVGPQQPAGPGPQEAGGRGAQREHAVAPVGQVVVRRRRRVGGEHAVGTGLDVGARGAGPQGDAVGTVHHLGTGQRVGERDRVRRGAGVPVGEHAVGVGADDRHARAGSQRQHAVVGQDDHRPRDHRARQLAARGQVEVVRGDGRPRVQRRVELAGPQAELELAQHRPVDVRLLEEPPLERRRQPADGDARVGVVVGEGVDAGTQRRRGRRDVVGEVALGRDEVRRRTGVADHEQGLRGPGPDEVEQLARDVVGPPVDQVVRRHHGAHRHRPRWVRGTPAARTRAAPAAAPARWSRRGRSRCE